MSRRYECTCSDCGKQYEITCDIGNPYFCPECDVVRRERISKSFEKIAMEFERKAVAR